MELKQLEYLVAAAECRSLNKAAERLFTCQPNVSKVLKNLEEELSLKLFERTSKGISLTGEGEQVCVFATEILFIVDCIEEIADIHGAHSQCR